MLRYSDRRRIGAEFVGSGFLLAAVIGSGIMSERLAGGNQALALLGNTLPTGAILAVIIAIFAPISGAHFNPVVTLAFLIRKEIVPKLALSYIAAQVSGAAIGVVVAHSMFDLPIFELSAKARMGSGQVFSEFIATFGLLTTILATLKARSDFIPVAVGLYITAAYWFTGSTSFANPAATIARAFSDTFAGIRAADVPLFIVAQTVGALAAILMCNWLLADENRDIVAQPAPGE
jgi:glycerol uptake facilitator-like aquaporin